MQFVWEFVFDAVPPEDIDSDGYIVQMRWKESKGGRMMRTS